MSKHILIVDDDVLMRRSLSISLERVGYAVSEAASGEEALQIAQAGSPDLVLLDIGLPGIDGLEVLRLLQIRMARVPVIFITARRRVLDEIIGLELGADAYISKPFDTDVLLAHIKAILRRSGATLDTDKEGTVVVGDITINPAEHVVRVGDEMVELPRKEFNLLLVLAQNSGHVLSFDELLSQLWGEGWIGESQTLYVHMCWLREKIEEDPAHPRRLLTVRGVGYKLVPLPNRPNVCGSPQSSDQGSEFIGSL
jgi:two-component system response regulator RegX3